MYLITNENNQYKNLVWTENITHSTTNPNFQFTLYKTPEIGSYLFPAYENFQNAKIWKSIPENFSQNDYLAKAYSVTTIEEIPTQFPTQEQRITCSILCSLTYVTNPIFKNWAINYLKKIDQSKETAHSVQEKLLDYPDNVLNPEFNYVSPAINTLGSVILNDTMFLTANSILRTITDSKEFYSKFDLEKIIKICNMIPMEEIANLLE